MPRSKLINPKKSIQIRLPEDLFARILSELYSPVEGCVPYAKQSEFIEMCIRDYFRRKEEQCQTTTTTAGSISSSEGQNI